jgi:hypothetical protein
MSRRKDDTPSVATYADYEVITPPHELRKAVAPAGDVIDDPVARAEAALTELSSEFSNWMESECDRLEAARQDDSLCRLIEHTPDMQRIPLPLLDQHVDAVRAVVREYGRADLIAAATALTKRLREVTDEFLKTENSFPAGLSGKHFCAAAGSRRLTRRPFSPLQVRNI